MKKYILITLSFVISTYCFSQYNRCNGLGIEIQINFYPSSGGHAIYTIVLLKDSLEIKDLGSRYNKGSIYRKVLNKKDLRKIQQTVNEIKQRNEVKTEIILDSWRTELFINGNKYYNESGIRFKTLPKDIKSLIELLIRGSTVKIDLYDFS